MPKTKNMKRQLLLLLTLSFVSVSFAQSKSHKDSLNVLVKKYYDLNLKVFQANSKPVDIDKIFELFTDDFTYIHPKYGGLYTREVLYKGYIRNQKNGGYDSSVEDITINNKIFGLNAVVVSRSYHRKGEGVEEAKMTLFEFKNGKISKIFEYW